MMAFKRRQLLRRLLFLLGASCVVTREPAGIAAVAASATPVTGTETKSGTAATTEMEKVTGIGGFFFRAKDPEGLARWYEQHLGITLTPTSYQAPVWQQEAGPTIFNPFPEKTDYFGDSSKMWMVNFRVRDLDKMVAQLQAAGFEVTVDTQTYPNGRFAHLHDPEGNPIELWQPAKPDAPH
jgi:glyoxylase I family protein